MRWIVGIIFLLSLVAGLACQIDFSGSSTANPPPPSAWRLTPNGWQKMASRTVQIPVEHAQEDPSIGLPHPIVLALFVSLLSLLALVAFSPSRPTSNLGPEHDSPSELVYIELRSQAWLNGC
ncbi:MAG TPA: hypothetical protein VMJ32_16685 [Pirellulales bacterium]|nr:hypothetical protein [Pirellulales bacterium]